MSTMMIDTTPDLDLSVDVSSNGTHVLSPLSAKRTLLLAPPSIAAHEDKLHALFATFDRSASDLQMLDRLSAGLVTLPAATYDLVLLLTDPDGGLRAEATTLLTRDVFDRIVPSMRPGATLSAQDGIAVDEREAVLAGLISNAKGGFSKPDPAEEEAVSLPLRFGKKKNINTDVNGVNGAQINGGANGLAHSSAGPAVASITVPVAGKATTFDMKPASAVPAGVGFVELDLGDYESGDELLDEDDILTEADRNRPIQQPPECAPKPGQRRKPCKDCTCGLAERMEAQDAARRAKADKEIATIKLASEDLSEMDFTVQGKKGSCNSCSLGDAFRCDGCPYLGLPAFKPGEEVTILNNAVQL